MNQLCYEHFFPLKIDEDTDETMYQADECIELTTYQHHEISEDEATSNTSENGNDPDEDNEQIDDFHDEDYEKYRIDEEKIMRTNENSESDFKELEETGDFEHVEIIIKPVLLDYEQLMCAPSARCKMCRKSVLHFRL